MIFLHKTAIQKLYMWVSCNQGMVMTMESDPFEILKKEAAQLDAFVLDRTPENPHPFEALIKSCNDKYGVDVTLDSLEKVLYAINKKHIIEDVVDAICHAYYRGEDNSWLEILTKFIMSDNVDYHEYAWFINHICGFDVEERELCQELCEQLPKNSIKWLGAAGEVIALDSSTHANPMPAANILHRANGEEWEYEGVLEIVNLNQYADLAKEQKRECFEFAKNHPLANERIIATSNKILQGDLK